MFSKSKDSFFTGIAISVLLATLSFAVVYCTNLLLTKLNFVSSLMPYSKLLIASMVLVVIYFRLNYLKWNKPQTANGALIVLFSAVILFIFMLRQA